MDEAIKIGVNGERTEVTAREVAHLHTTTMGFRCKYCDKSVVFNHRHVWPGDFTHRRQNKDCPYPRRKRVDERRSISGTVVLRPGKKARY